MVEICFFNSEYTHRWPLSPLYYENNVQGVGKADFKDAQTLKHPDLVQRQSEYVSKITREVNGYDNVILEICDEPSNFTQAAEAGPWVGRLLEVVHNTESTLPKKHLVAQEVQGGIGGPIDYSGSPMLSIIVGQYVWGPEQGSAAEMGGMKGLDYEYGHNKPIEFNETSYYPFQYRKGDAIAASRVEAWEFIVGGGASFNHLNSRYTVEDPAGKTPDNAQILSALQNLKNFIYSFDFVKMSPDKNFVVSGIPGGTYCRGISQPGEQYALYHHHSVLETPRPTMLRLQENTQKLWCSICPGAPTRPIGSIPPRGRCSTLWPSPIKAATKRLPRPSTRSILLCASNAVTEARSLIQVRWACGPPKVMKNASVRQPLSMDRRPSFVIPSAAEGSAVLSTSHQCYSSKMNCHPVRSERSGGTCCSHAFVEMFFDRGIMGLRPTQGDEKRLGPATTPL